ncbi:conserved hypothetical protein [Talaromyces stipitatus ATCC 10500]|uniref:Uncharacterized protein n=1 Tax=Talaromyces stipitatus (strain ATCC 10500 / CBS 375.48 / QM 6759 / NRRL 1006) TaxID=441959 RepID=B8MKM5_TALSN|nr:uncharacterized protein TSTA_048230 [Talaromyces stipitatus ATCC 10500]EED15380.1 conserved hypothetical protein [Talaromyces stipitatus ATCC 10500]
MPVRELSHVQLACGLHLFEALLGVLFESAWWEFTCAGIGLSQEDKEWKTLLQKYMPDYTDACEFWLDFYALSKYPSLDERGMELLNG